MSLSFAIIRKITHKSGSIAREVAFELDSEQVLAELIIFLNDELAKKQTRFKKKFTKEETTLALQKAFQRQIQKVKDESIRIV